MLQFIVVLLDSCPIYLISLVCLNLAKPKKKKEKKKGCLAPQNARESSSLSNYKACCLIVQIFVGLARCVLICCFSIKLERLGEC